MQIVQLEAFVAVIKHQSFSKAARALYVSQPTISSYISILEKEFGVQLITRSTKNLTPTSEGKLLYEYSIKIIALCNQAKQEISETETSQSGTIEISASSTPSLSILPSVLAKISKDHPDLYFLVHQCDSDDVIRSVIRMECDLGITGATFSRGNCEFVPFYEDKLIVITPNTKPFQKMNGHMSIENIKTLPFISRELGSGTKIEYETFLKKEGITNDKMNFVAQMFNTESILYAVRSGLGISIVSKLSAEEHIRNGNILCFELDSPLLMRNLYFVYRKNQILPSSVRLLMDYIKEYCSQYSV